MPLLARILTLNIVVLENVQRLQTGADRGRVVRRGLLVVDNNAHLLLALGAEVDCAFAGVSLKLSQATRAVEYGGAARQGSDKDEQASASRVLSSRRPFLALSRSTEVFARALVNLQDVDQVADLAGRRLRVLVTRAHVDDRAGILVEARENTGVSSYRIRHSEASNLVTQRPAEVDLSNLARRYTAIPLGGMTMRPRLRPRCTDTPKSRSTGRHMTNVSPDTPPSFPIADSGDSHLAGLSLDRDVPRLDELGAELAAPLHGRLDTLLAVLELPLGGAHEARVRAHVLEEALLPYMVRVGLGEEECLRVLLSAAARGTFVASRGRRRRRRLISTEPKSSDSGELTCLSSSICLSVHGLIVPSRAKLWAAA